MQCFSIVDSTATAASTGAADVLAKAAVQKHRGPADVVDRISQHVSLQVATARWTGQVTVEANQYTAGGSVLPMNTTASRMRAYELAKSAEALGVRRHAVKVVQTRPIALCGHRLV